MNVLYNLLGGMGTQRQNPEAKALEEISRYQRERIGELEQKKMEIDLELKQARQMLEISQSRAGSLEPRISLEREDGDGPVEGDGPVDGPVDGSPPAWAQSSSLRASSQPAVVSAASLEASLQAAFNQGEFGKLEDMLRASISRLKEFENDLQVSTIQSDERIARMRQQHIRDIQDLQQKQALPFSQAGGVGAASRSARKAIYARASRARARRVTQRGTTTEEDRDPGTQEEDDGTRTPRPSTRPYTRQSGSDEERIAVIVQRVLERMKGKGAGGGGRRRKASEPMVADEDPDDKLEFLALNRKLFHEAFGITKDENFALCDTVLMQQVHDWLNGRSEGPNPDNLQFDMTAKHHSPWNTVVIEHLTKLLQEKAREMGYLPERPEAYFRAMIQEKFKRCQRIWKRSRPTMDNDGFLESPEQLEKRITDLRDLKMKESRQMTRRRTKWTRRVQIAEHMVKFKAVNDLRIWKWLLKLVKQLGPEGMSSEESDDQNDTEVVFRVKRLPWRRDITKELSLIDAIRLKEKGIFAPQGSKPVKRIHGGERLVSIREAPGFLPRELYNEDWLKEQRFPHLKPGFSSLQFDWIEIEGIAGARG